MEHILVMPMHDPKGIIFPHVERMTPTLKPVFARAVISIKPEADATPNWLVEDEFFSKFPVSASLPVGAHFRALYEHAAQTCPPDAVLHLCFPDRLAFQLECGFGAAFLEDIRSLTPAVLPLIFQRSAAAWDTHPANYRAVESAITTIGEQVCRKTLDFAWCHLAVTAGALRQILPAVHRSDMSMMAEIVVQLSGSIHTRDVDWLAWEDPFILNQPAAYLKHERENSLQETRKRLSYALPMMDVLYEAAAKG